MPKPKTTTKPTQAAKLRKECAAQTKRWTLNRSDELAVKNGCWFDESVGQFVVDWIERYCVLYEGEYAGQKMELRDWQYDAVMRIFGWQKWSTRWGRPVRRFRQVWIWVPKKNKKSPTLAALGLYLTCGDGEQGGKVYFCAKDGSQAREIAGKHAIEMCQLSEELSSSCSINKANASVTHRATRSLCKPISSADTRSQKSKEGLNGSALIDEVHVVDEDFVGRISRAGISRSEPLMIGVSTAGEDPLSFGYKKYEYGKKVEAGEERNEQLLHICYEAPQDLSDEDLDADPIKYGKMANPAWGHTIDAEEFLADYIESKKSPSELARFKMYRLNIWQRVAASYLKPAAWKKCYQPFTDEELAEHSAVGCMAGLDLSKVADMTALALMFPRPEGRFRLRPFFWLPEETVWKSDSRETFETWIAQKLLIVTPGSVCDYNRIAADVVEIFKRFGVQRFAFDPWQAEQFTQGVEASTGIERIAFPQTISNFAEATGEFERLVIDGKLEHNGNEIMTWQAGNAKVYSDANGNKRPIKPKPDDKRKIDGIVAAIMALRLFLVGGSTQSVYDSQERQGGLLVL